MAESRKKRSSDKTRVDGPVPGVLARLASEEAQGVLNELLKRHPNLCAEAEAIVATAVSPCCVDDIASNVHSAVTRSDLEDLNGRAGAHSLKCSEELSSKEGQIHYLTGASVVLDGF
jgi:hypothetical protein